MGGAGDRLQSRRARRGGGLKEEEGELHKGMTAGHSKKSERKQRF